MVRITPIYKPFSPFGRGITLHRELTNHGYQPLTNWDDPPSTPIGFSVRGGWVWWKSFSGLSCPGCVFEVPKKMVPSMPLVTSPPNKKKTRRTNWLGLQLENANNYMGKMREINKYPFKKDGLFRVGRCVYDRLK